MASASTQELLGAVLFISTGFRPSNPAPSPASTSGRGHLRVASTSCFGTARVPPSASAVRHGERAAARALYCRARRSRAPRGEGASHVVLVPELEAYAGRGSPLQDGSSRARATASASPRWAVVGISSSACGPRAGAMQVRNARPPCSHGAAAPRQSPAPPRLCRVGCSVSSRRNVLGSLPVSSWKPSATLAS